MEWERKKGKEKEETKGDNFLKKIPTVGILRIGEIGKYQEWSCTNTNSFFWCDQIFDPLFFQSFLSSLSIFFTLSFSVSCHLSVSGLEPVRDLLSLSLSLLQGQKENMKRKREIVRGILPKKFPQSVKKISGQFCSPFIFYCS